MKCMEGLFSPPPSSHGLRSSSLGVFLAAFSVSALMCRATLSGCSLSSLFFFFRLSAVEETFFLKKKPQKKKKSTHILSTPTQLGDHIALVLFVVVVMALARETTRAAESDEMKTTMKKKNKTPPSQHNSPTVHHPFSFHCSATCSHGMLRCDVCLFFFCRVSVSLSLSFSRLAYFLLASKKTDV